MKVRAGAILKLAAGTDVIGEEKLLTGRIAPTYKGKVHFLRIRVIWTQKARCDKKALRP